MNLKDFRIISYNFKAGIIDVRDGLGGQRVVPLHVGPDVIEATLTDGKTTVTLESVDPEVASWLKKKASAQWERG